MTVEEFLNIINVEHRQRISSSFIHIRTQNFYDEIFPIQTKYGELWIHSKLGNKIVREDNTIIAIGFSQILDEETNTSLYKNKEDSRLKELLVRQFALSQSLSNFLKSADTPKVITDTLKDYYSNLTGTALIYSSTTRQKVHKVVSTKLPGKEFPRRSTHCRIWTSTTTSGGVNKCSTTCLSSSTT